MHAQELCYGEP